MSISQLVQMSIIYDINKYENQYTFTPCVFKNTYKGYIVTPKIIIPTRKTVPDILNNGKQWETMG